MNIRRIPGVVPLAIQLLLLKERLKSGVTFNPLSVRYREDPYPKLRELRERDPVHRMELTGTWQVTRYADVAWILRDPRFSADRDPPDTGLIDHDIVEQSAFVKMLSENLLGLDPPDHTRLRNLVNMAFTPRVIAAMEPRVQAITDQLLDAATERAMHNGRQIDVIKDLAEPLPVTVISELLGVPSEDHAQFRRWSYDLARALDPLFEVQILDNADRAVRELTEYFRPLVEARRRAPGDDLISALVRAEEEGDRLSEDELYAFCVLLLGAGSETTTNLIGNGFLALHQQPEQLRLLRDDPSLADSAIEELLRFDAPVQLTSRVALEDVTIGERAVRAGEFIVLSLAGANRDPAQFADPDRLDVTRAENRHLSFSLGNHYCLGSPLARLEARTAIMSLLERFPATSLLDAEPRWREMVTLRGLTTLPVAV
ncbi:MAG TPA: cytochrome P450 [Dehalococcoidia bacterium]|nr:cytochrome P450 [Dehalococcoidia bacterium]